MISFTVKNKYKGNAEKKLQHWKTVIRRKKYVGIRREAELLRAEIVKGIVKQAPGGQAFTPLAESTIKMKGSSKALIDTGGLIASIGTTYDGEVAFVGVNRSARTAQGQDYINIAEIHEYGTDPYEIVVTKKMAAWSRAMFLKKVLKGTFAQGQTLMHPGIPARPFMRPAFEQWSRNATERYESWLARALNMARRG